MKRRPGGGMGRAAHLLVALVPFVAALGLAGPSAARPEAPAPSLQQRLARALRVPGTNARLGSALAVDLQTEQVVFARNETLSLLPASTEKLAVGYAALVRLGPGYRFRTEVVGLGSFAAGVWRGDLVLQGHGDPTLDRDDLAALASDVRAWGIRRVTGAVLADESAYDALRTGPGWKASYFIDECAPLSALVADRSRYATRISLEPARTAATLFHEALVGAGVAVGKRSRRVLETPETALPLAQDVSEPLAAILRVMGRDSDNFLAEMLLKQLGEVLAGRGTTAAGARVVMDTLAAAGVPLAGVRIADGSGLSRLDRTTAAALVAILRAGVSEPAIRDAFLDSLAVAGVDGTLRHRMESRPARSRVIAKTGTTSRASALAGFVRNRYVFAVVQNGSPVSTFWSRRAQDRFATVLAGA
jgi:D-alanyl-D-alanine carboxypeptidase/D-alanyl-D-alanine-endopeptidase (penicillin-binding protein 4)